MAGPIFPGEEFDTRYQLLRNRLEQMRLDAIVAYSPGNQFWLTGCVGLLVSSHETTFAYDTLYPKVVLPAEGDPILIGLRICEEAYAQETHITDIRTFIPPVWERRSEAMQSVLSRVVSRHRRVGIDVGEFSTITPTELKMLQERLPSTEFVDVSPAFRELRAIKSIREQTNLKEAARIQVEAFKLLRQRLHAGMSETEILGELIRCQIEAGATDTAVAIAWTHPGYAFFRSPWRNRKLQAGDFLWVDGGAVFNGYCSDIDEVFVVGRPGAEHIELFESLTQVYEEGLKLWQPGRTARTIAQGTQEILRRFGARNALEPEIFVGHGLGHEVVEEPVFASWSPPELRLQEGMVVAPEWYNQTRYGAMLFEDTFLVGRDGLEPLVSYQRELWEIPR